jgi:hypothetical protein
MRREPDWDADDWQLARALNGEDAGEPLSLPEPPIVSDELHDADDDSDADAEWFDDDDDEELSDADEDAFDDALRATREPEIDRYWEWRNYRA